MCLHSGKQRECTTGTAMWHPQGRRQWYEGRCRHRECGAHTGDGALQRGGGQCRYRARATGKGGGAAAAAQGGWYRHRGCGTAVGPVAVRGRGVCVPILCALFALCRYCALGAGAEAPMRPASLQTWSRGITIAGGGPQYSHEMGA